MGTLGGKGLISLIAATLDTALFLYYIIIIIMAIFTAVAEASIVCFESFFSLPAFAVLPPLHINSECPSEHSIICTRGIQKVLRQILKNILFMKFTKLFFYIVTIQFITLPSKEQCFHRKIPGRNFSIETSLTEVL